MANPNYISSLEIFFSLSKSSVFFALIGNALKSCKLVKYIWNRTKIHMTIIFNSVLFITKTCLYKYDPIEPHFYIVKLGFTGVYIIFQISAQNIDCGYSLEPPRRGGFNEYPQSMFWAEMWKISEFLYLKMFSFWRWIFLYIWVGVFS